MTTVYQIKYFCKAPCLMPAAQLYQIHSRFQNISFKTTTKNVAFDIRNLSIIQPAFPLLYREFQNHRRSLRHKNWQTFRSF